MARLEAVLSAAFGYMLLALSFFVTAETLSRKLFNFSFQGADELGGYTLAVGSSLAFTIALIGRSHIRIDLVHQKLGPVSQAVLNWLSMLLLGVFGVLLAWVGRQVIEDTLLYQSTAPTPWATPLIYPQGLWYGALCIFTLVAVLFAVRATVLLFSRRVDELNIEFHPKGLEEELQEELGDLKQR